MILQKKLMSIATIALTAAIAVNISGCTDIKQPPVASETLAPPETTALTTVTEPVTTVEPEPEPEPICTIPPDAVAILGQFIFVGERVDVDSFYRIKLTECDECGECEECSAPDDAPDISEDEDEEEVEDVDEDADEVEDIFAEFVSEPDWEYIGTQPVTVKVSDIRGNYTVVESDLTILHDTTPPVIHRARDMSVLLGGRASFRSDVYVTDDLDPNPQLSIDSRGVDMNRVGIYPITYTARDRAGNTSSITVNVHVIEVSVQDLHDLADRRLESLGVFNTESLPERAKLIHDYVRGNMAYVRSIGPGNFSDAHFAYSILRSMRGNCIASQRVSEVLLARAGIENQRIRNIDDTHSWNLIRIDDVWYHYDSTWFECRYRGSYMFTNETAREISPARRNRYVWDESAYPPIAES